MKFSRISAGLLVLAGALAVSGCDSAVERDVRGYMKDPSSAEFRNIRECPDMKGWYTGEVNGKNSFGAYDGFSEFVDNLSIVRMKTGNYEDDTVFRMWKADCDKGDKGAQTSKQAEAIANSAMAGAAAAADSAAKR